MVLNSDGGTMFNNGIPYLSVQRPNLFQNYNATLLTTTSTSDTTGTDIADSTIIMSDRLGTVQYGILEGIGDIFGLDPITFASVLCWLAFIICGIIAAANKGEGGGFVGGLICGVVFIGMGLMFGAIQWSFILQGLGAIGAMIAFRIFVNNAG
jgi:hypothetical protein